ncbi:MAG: hypothetical protein MUQ41_02965, partial [Loktanella sp.]|nr:hypothetical protein [Loktanella sp.]
MYTYKETNKLYALLRFIVIYMPKNEVRIYNSKAVIYQNDYDVWQFRIWLADEDKYFRQSLRTRFRTHNQNMTVAARAMA